MLLLAAFVSLVGFVFGCLVFVFVGFVLFVAGLVVLILLVLFWFAYKLGLILLGLV